MSEELNTQPTGDQPEQQATPAKPDTAIQPPAEAKKTDTKRPPETWEEIFQHPRFSQLLEQNKELEQWKSEQESEKQKLADEKAEAERVAAEEQGKWEELYKQSQTELEKSREDKKEADARAQKSEIKALRTQIAAEVGLPPKLATRLQGETDEEIRADAEAILELMPGTPAPPLKTDGSNGNNKNTPSKPSMTEAEIKEEAARLGVGYSALKQVYESQQV